MKIPNAFFSLIAVICGVTSFSKSSEAQSNLATGPLFIRASDPTISCRESPATHSVQLSLPTTQPTPDDSDLEKPLYACACGCGIFEVGAATMFPDGAGGMLYLEYDYQDQNIDWGGVRPAAGSANPDKNIRTNFLTLGVQYFFDRSWGVQIELPYDNRKFVTETYAPAGGLAHEQWGAFGDLRLQAIYTGFSEDQSIGVSFGLKLPTGNWQHNNPYGDVDRDSEIGTGSIDILAGGFFRHQFAGHYTGFAQIALDAPIDESEGYRPGLEADGALGAYYTGLELHGVKITPIGQVLLSERAHDSGPNAAHPLQSGYQRLLLSPGIEFDYHPFSIYADIEVPVYQHFSGDQLSAPFLMKVILTYHF